MHIAFIVTRADSIGGAQIHVRDLSLRLHNEGNQVSVLTGSGGPLTDILLDAGITVRILPHLVRPMDPLKDLIAIVEARRALSELKPDLVSTHTAKAGLVGRIAAWSLGIPSIFTAHGWQFAEGISPFQRFIVESLERFTARICRKIITVSHYDENLALQRRVVPREKLVTIHNGMPDIPPDLVHSAERSSLNPVRLIMVARLQPQKDHPTLFRALAGLQDRDWTLELIGDGPDRESLETLAEELGIAERVIFAGQRMDVPERLKEANLFVLITRWEGFPRSILEAMRAGLPVVATDVGGCRESVVDGETGFLVGKEDIGEVQEKLRELIDSEDLRKRMGEAGRKRFEENFTFETMYQRTREVYQEAVSNP